MVDCCQVGTTYIHSRGLPFIPKQSGALERWVDLYLVAHCGLKLVSSGSCTSPVIQQLSRSAPRSMGRTKWLDPLDLILNLTVKFGFVFICTIQGSLGLKSYPSREAQPATEAAAASLAARRSPGGARAQFVLNSKNIRSINSQTCGDTINS